MKERPLGDDELGAIEKHGLFNLSSFLPKKPDDAQLNAIIEMFHASVQEELYDPDRWGQYYRPNGMRMEGTASGDAEQAEVSQPVTKPAVTASSIMEKAAASKAASEPVAQPAVAAQAGDKPKMSSPDDILAAIRARKLNQQ